MKTRQLTLIYTALAIVVLSFYGICTCVHMTALPTLRVGLVFAAVLVPVNLLKLLVSEKFLSTCTPDRRSYRIAHLEIATFASCGLILGFFNLLAFDLPLVDSGGTVLIGCIFFGVVSGLDHALAEDRAWIKSHGDMQVGERPARLARRLLIGGGIMAAITLTVVLLAVYQDYLISRGSGGSSRELVQKIVTDVAVGAVIVSVFSVRLLYSLTSNMGLLFDQQVAALNRVRDGFLDVHVPIKTPDEFGLVASRLNRMIMALREREKIKSTLGKVVSPQIAERLMQQDTKSLRQGQRVKVAILFSDIRGFTTITEQSKSEELLAMLNTHFRRSYEIIVRHHGYIEKFIGDAVLAIFGLDQVQGAAENALRAAQEMVRDDSGLLTPQGEPMRLGVGLHFGEVAAGVIGPDERYEYTVIGDNVNTAARLESLSKELKHKVVLSDAIYECLSDSCQAEVTDLGEHDIRGKLKRVHLYGHGVVASS